MKGLKQIVAIIILIIFQVVVMEGVYMSTTLLPSIYIYFILIMSIRIPSILMFIVSFLIGLSVDVFTDTLGVNALACLVMALVRHFYVQNLDRAKLERNSLFIPSKQMKTRSWYLQFMAVLTLVHHSVFFIVSDWSSAHFLETLFVIVVSTLSTLIFMIIFDVIFYKDKV